MAWKPVVDSLEGRIESLLGVLATVLAVAAGKPHRGPATEDELQSMIEDSDLEQEFDEDGVPQERRKPPHSRTRPRVGQDADEEFKPRLLSSNKTRQALARTC